MATLPMVRGREGEGRTLIRFISIISKEGGNKLEQESIREKTMEDTGGRLHPALDGQSLKQRKARQVEMKLGDAMKPLLTSSNRRF